MRLLVFLLDILRENEIDVCADFIFVWVQHCRMATNIPFQSTSPSIDSMAILGKQKPSATNFVASSLLL